MYCHIIIILQYIFRIVYQAPSFTWMYSMQSITIICRNSQLSCEFRVINSTAWITVLAVVHLSTMLLDERATAQVGPSVCYYSLQQCKTTCLCLEHLEQIIWWKHCLRCYFVIFFRFTLLCLNSRRRTEYTIPQELAVEKC